jgi:hypothetical protein
MLRRDPRDIRDVEELPSFGLREIIRSVIGKALRRRRGDIHED